LWAIEWSVAEASACAHLLNSRSRFRQDCWDLAVRRIGHEPGTATSRDFVDVAELCGVADLALRITAEELGTFERLLLALLHQVSKILRGDFVEALSSEGRRALERSPVFVLVGVVTLKIRIAPWSSGMRGRAG